MRFPCQQATHGYRGIRTRPWRPICCCMASLYQSCSRAVPELYQTKHLNTTPLLPCPVEEENFIRLSHSFGSTITALCNARSNLLLPIFLFSRQSPADINFVNWHQTSFYVLSRSNIAWPAFIQKATIIWQCEIQFWVYVLACVAIFVFGKFGQWTPLV